MKHTKKEYEEYLNDLGIDEEDKYVIAGKLRGVYFTNRKYGTALRKYDPIAFEVGYNDWKNEREHSSSRYNSY